MQIMVRGQMKVQQMVFMLLAVTLFFILAGLFIFTIQFSKLKGSAAALDEKNALLLVTKLANSPEFSCGDAFGESLSNCVDSDKLMALKQNIQAYSKFWDVDNIEVRKIYPTSNEVECTTTNYPNCDIIKIKSGGISSEFSNFVSLCRKSQDEKIYNQCDMAKLIISYGNKTKWKIEHKKKWLDLH